MIKLGKISNQSGVLSRVAHNVLFAKLLSGTSGTPQCIASAVPKMNPRDSIATTASGRFARRASCWVASPKAAAPEFEVSSSGWDPDSASQPPKKK